MHALATIGPLAINVQVLCFALFFCAFALLFAHLGAAFRSVPLFANVCCCATSCYLYRDHVKGHDRWHSRTHGVRTWQANTWRNYDSGVVDGICGNLTGIDIDHVGYCIEQSVFVYGLRQ